MASVAGSKGGLSEEMKKELIAKRNSIKKEGGIIYANMLYGYGGNLKLYNNKDKSKQEIKHISYGDCNSLCYEPETNNVFYTWHGGGPYADQVKSIFNENRLEKIGNILCSSGKELYSLERDEDEKKASKIRKGLTGKIILELPPSRLIQFMCFNPLNQKLYGSTYYNEIYDILENKLVSKVEYTPKDRCILDQIDNFCNDPSTGDMYCSIKNKIYKILAEKKTTNQKFEETFTIKDSTNDMCFNNGNLLVAIGNKIIDVANKKTLVEVGWTREARYSGGHFYDAIYSGHKISAMCYVPNEFIERVSKNKKELSDQITRSTESSIVNDHDWD